MSEVSDDFCLVHGYKHMERRFGDPIARCVRCERASDLEHEADILERDAPNRYRRAIAVRRERAKQLREDDPAPPRNGEGE